MPRYRNRRRGTRSACFALTVWACAAAFAEEPGASVRLVAPPAAETQIPSVPATIVQPEALQLEGGPATTIVEPGMTLEELELIAQTAHPALREASAKVGVAQGNAVQAGMYPNPTLYTGSPQWTGSISQYNVFVGQDFVTAGKLRLSQDAAFRAVEQAQLEFTRTRYEVLTEVRRQFYTTACAQRRVEVLEQLTGIASRSRDLGQKLLQAGETNRADATLLEIEFDKAEATLANAAARLAAARAELAAVAGVPDIEIGRLQFDLDALLPEYELEAVRRGVIDSNAAAASAAVEIQRMRRQLRRAEVEPWPDVNIQAGYQYSVEAPLHDQGYAQLAMTVPLWNRNQGAIRAARADTVRATAALQRTENELAEQTAAALGEYLAADRRATIFRERIRPKADDVFTINRSMFEQGQTDFLHLLQAQRTLVEADLGYLEAQEARWSAAATIAGLLQLEQFP